MPDRDAQVVWRPSPWTRRPWLCDDGFTLAECVVTDASVVSDHAGLCGEVVHVERDADVALLHGMRRFGCWSAAPAGPAAPGGPAVPAAERPGPVEGARA